ncbi:unnamed protein product, partial [Mesorhabditis belari]|uniref:Uncharacterized protein n=1 Tax=Mesorhabditis belari TaxID=2138241 RepID=A0AAF3EWN1_9BILA
MFRIFFLAQFFVFITAQFYSSGYGSCSQYLSQPCSCPSYCRSYIQMYQGYYGQGQSCNTGGYGMSSSYGNGQSGYGGGYGSYNGQGGAYGPSANYFAGYNGKWTNSWGDSDPQGGSYQGPHKEAIGHYMSHRKKFHFDFDSLEDSDDRITLPASTKEKDVWSDDAFASMNSKSSAKTDFDEELPEFSSSEVRLRPEARMSEGIPSLSPSRSSAGVPFPSGTSGTGLGGIGIGGGVNAAGVGVNTGLGINAPGLGSPGGGSLVGVSSGLNIGIPGIGPIGIGSGIGIGKK